MSRLTLHFETAGDADLTAMQQYVKSRFETLADVESVDTRAAHFRSLAAPEIIAAVTLSSQPSVGIEAINALVTAAKTVIATGRGLCAAAIDVGVHNIPLDQLTPEHIATLSKKLARRAAL